MFQKLAVKYLIISALIFLLHTAASFADEIAVTATVDKTEASLEDSITLSVQVSGTQNNPAPQIPSLPEFRVQSLGSSSSVQIINMKMNSSVSFNYRLTPVKKGTFIIPPVSVAIDGKTFTSEPITLSIKEPSPMEQNAPVFVQTTVSNDKPYINEQVTLTLKLYRKVDVRNINLNANYDKFRKEDMGKEREYAEVINGINYNVLELSVALFPAKTGDQEIPPAILDLDVLHRTRERRPMNDPFAHFFDDSFLFGGRVQTEHKTLRTHPIVLKVQPLPETGKPQSFSNLVGQFTIASELGKDNVEVGDSATLTVTVAGKGNVKDIPEPQLNLPDTIKIYPDQPAFKQEIEGNKITGKKTFKYALVPMQEGKTDVPPILLPYFDPVQKKYVTAHTKSLFILVNPSKTKESLNVATAENPKPKHESVKITGKDILPIHTRVSEFSDQQLTLDKILFYITCLTLPIIIFFSFSLYLKYKRRLQFDVAWSRKRMAYKLARKKLDALPALHISDTKEFAKELSKILREYIGNKLNLQGTAFTSGEMTQLLKEKNYKENLVQSISLLLEKHESLQYAPARVNGDLSTALLNESSNLLDQIEGQL